MKALISMQMTGMTLALIATSAISPAALGLQIGAGPKPGGQGPAVIDPSPPGTNVRPEATNTLRIKARTPASITLKWHNRSDVEDGNRLFRHTSREFFMRDAQEVTDLGPLNTPDGWVEHTDSDVGSDTPYCYQVRPFNAYGTSYSNIACDVGPVRTRVRLLTHNVFGQPEEDCKERAIRLGESIAYAQPAYDVVAVQEYYHNTDAGLFSCSSKHLRKAITGPPANRYRNRRNRYLFKPIGDWYLFELDGGVGVFSLHPIDDSGQWVWDKAPYQTRKQGFTFARVRIPNIPVTLDVYVVHPHSENEGCSPDCNQSNMQQLAEKISSLSRNSRNPIIVMGDFNIDANPDIESSPGGNPPYQAIVDALHNPRDLWKEAHPNADPSDGYTRDSCGTVENYECTAGISGKRIDYIFVVSDRSLTTSPYDIVITDPDDVRVVKWTYLPDEYPYFRHRVSDHFGLEATIEIRDRWSNYEDDDTNLDGRLKWPISPGTTSGAGHSRFKLAD